MVLLLEPDYGSAGTNLPAPAKQTPILSDCPKRVDADSVWGYYEHDFQKSWKDKQGDWQDQSISLQARDILAVQQALAMAYVDSFESDGDDE